MSNISVQGTPCFVCYVEGVETSRDKLSDWIEDVRKSIVLIDVLVFFISLSIFLTGMLRASFTCWLKLVLTISSINTNNS